MYENMTNAGCEANRPRSECADVMWPKNDGMYGRKYFQILLQGNYATAYLISLLMPVSRHP
jgi:hypothetical protein